MDTISAPKGGHIVGSSVRTQEEIRWAHNRPHAARPPMCKPGDRVLYRSNEWFDEVPAIVIEVEDQDRENLNLFNEDGTLRPDPWPFVVLKVDPDQIPAHWDKRRRALARVLIRTQEARLEGSAGWLHPLWQMYPRPLIRATPA